MSDERGKATRIKLSDVRTPAMRTFHLAWVGLFCSFFAWFSVAPLMPTVRQEFALSKEQVGWCIIGSVAVTVIARIVVGPICDVVGPRRSFAWLLLLSALPVMGMGLSSDYATFLACRVAAGVIGAAFVVAQYHTSQWFAARCVGTANATVAGWGNLGAGFSQWVMPWVYAALLHLTDSTSLSWRLAMVLTGLVCVGMAAVYYTWASDPAPKPCPSGLAKNSRRVVSAGFLSFVNAILDSRVTALAVAYGACYGVELTMNNVAALYFLDHFAVFSSMTPASAMALAGLLAGLYGFMNIFARSLGGYLADLFGQRYAMPGRVHCLFGTLLAAGVALMLFSQVRHLGGAVVTLVLFSILIKMAQGATFAVVPHVKDHGGGMVTGIVGAGGNLGAVCAGFLFQSSRISWSIALFLLGLSVIGFSLLLLAVRFEVELAGRCLGGVSAASRAAGRACQVSPSASATCC